MDGVGRGMSFWGWKKGFGNHRFPTFGLICTIYSIIFTQKERKQTQMNHQSPSIRWKPTNLVCTPSYQGQVKISPVRSRFPRLVGIWKKKLPGNPSAFFSQGVIYCWWFRNPAPNQLSQLRLVVYPIHSRWCRISSINRMYKTTYIYIYHMIFQREPSKKTSLFHPPPQQIYETYAFLQDPRPHPPPWPLLKKKHEVDPFIPSRRYDIKTGYIQGIEDKRNHPKLSSPLFLVYQVTVPPPSKWGQSSIFSFVPWWHVTLCNLLSICLSNAR